MQLRSEVIKHYPAVPEKDPTVKSSRGGSPISRKIRDSHTKIAAQQVTFICVTMKVCNLPIAKENLDVRKS